MKAQASLPTISRPGQPVKYRALAVHALLTLLLLLSQHLGVAHSVTHLSHPAESTSSRDEQLPAELQCATCLAFASIGSAINGPAQFVAPDAAASLADLGIPSSSPLDDPLFAYQPRAPPSAL